MYAHISTHIMEHQSSSQLLAYSSPCRQLGLSSSSSGEMSGSNDDMPFSCHQIFREADGVAPMERSIEDGAPFAQPSPGVDTSSSEYQHHESCEPSPFLAITRANPISYYDSASNNDRYGAIVRGESCCEEGNFDMEHQILRDTSIEHDDVLRRYNTSTPSAGMTTGAIDFSPFFRANPAPVTPDVSTSTVVLNTDQSVLATNQIQPNFFQTPSPTNNDTTLLLGQDQNGQRSFSPSGVTEIQNQNQQRGGGRHDGDAAHHHQGYTPKLAPSTPIISNINSYVEDDVDQQQEQQRSPFRSRLYHDEQNDQHGSRSGSNLQYLHHPLIHASWTSTTDGSTVQLSSTSTSSSLLCSSTSAESCSFDASAAGGANNNNM